MRSAVVVVLGDVGRSPRIRNHACSLSERGVAVTLVGYDGAKLPDEVAGDANITMSYMTPYPAALARWLPRTVSYAAKALWQAFTLLCALPLAPWSSPPDVLLLQNPPSIPSLCVCQFYCRVFQLGRTALVVDWHNYGYSILALAHSPGSVLVRLSRWVERTFGRGAAANFSVTEAMRRDLVDDWGLDNVVTLYDRPPEAFRPIPDAEKNKFLSRMAEEFGASFLGAGGENGLLVSSTSWTEDEDFGVLLHALDEYESAREAQQDELPQLLCVITGKGPMKEYYCEQIRSRAWRHVSVLTPWLSAGDYPLLLSCADLGVSLHTSSSGLDLPMKVVDMMGCGVPVAAVHFSALKELVRHEQNGLVFRNPEELAAQVISWFRGFPSCRGERRGRFSAALSDFGAVRWRQYWLDTAWPVLQEACSAK